MLPPYKVETYDDFTIPENRKAMEAALKKVESELGKEYPIVIAGKKITTKEKIASINPSDKNQVVGYVSKADEKLAEQALQAALTAFETWRKVPWEARARYLIAIAKKMRVRKMELAAWMVYEEGKSWIEAIADTAEAIDFHEFYAREAIRMAGVAGTHAVTPWPDEQNELFYIPLGAGVAIPPWNFPLAIMSGITIAPVVAGNTVVLKPASAAPVIAAKYFEICEECEIPKGVINYCPGPGGSVGDYLVRHPKTRFVVFTGSMEVGKHINEEAAKFAAGQIWIKRVVLEMGGKDFVAVDDNCDIELAAQSIVASAFGFQGQKCSAGSRAIVHQKVYDAVLERAVELTKNLKVGNPVEYGIHNGGVIDEAGYKKILGYIEVGNKEGKLMIGGKAPKGAKGFQIENTIFADIKPKARLAQEEIFGPVVAFIKARNFDHILEIANGTIYGLTGALISKDREHLEIARREFHVGNLYLNRKCTGALVDVQPFGGFNMSGTDSKAGGRDYLLLFCQAKAVAERFS
ncbi:MAG: L-glutamate gamma-semialdehyde dehydrogenase [bacterium]|nr:L-glutamate gamma-semialdehyde dehydrogenase [bacterium]